MAPATDEVGARQRAVAVGVAAILEQVAADPTYEGFSQFWADIADVREALEAQEAAMVGVETEGGWPPRATSEEVVRLAALRAAQETPELGPTREALGAWAKRRRLGDSIVGGQATEVGGKGRRGVL